MLTIIPSSKSMDFNECAINKGTKPVFQASFNELLCLCRKLSEAEIQKIMKVSEKIAAATYQRFQNFDTHPQKQAIFAFNGDLYDPIERSDLTENQIDFMQKHIFIASGLYGLLSPLDYIRPYRLEMATKLEGQTLDHFWRPEATKHIIETLSNHKNKHLINLASMEYSAILDKDLLKDQIINIHFKEDVKGQLKTVAIHAKRARGAMVNFIIKNLIDQPEELKTFNENDYRFSSIASSHYDWVFIRSLS
jgi:uncharacterized protein